MADKLKLLIVEDDQYLLTLFRFALQTRGAEFDITTASDADTALQVAHEFKPDLMLLDIMLPGDVDGIEICRQIRSDPTMRGTGIVMVTALDDPATRQSAIEAGAADYWLKPINTRNLLDRVRAVLNVKHIAPSRMAAAEPIDLRRPARPATGAPATSTVPANLDTVMSSLKSTFSHLEPGDWAELQALAEARLAVKQATK